jgi:predicted AAA+ superfamily ATPase
MERRINADLVLWKSNPHRKPLLLRGARQIGKTYAIREFARNNFQHFVEINFELEPQYKELFTTLDASQIVRNLSLHKNNTFEPG